MHIGNTNELPKKEMSGTKKKGHGQDRIPNIIRQTIYLRQ